MAKFFSKLSPAFDQLNRHISKEFNLLRRNQLEKWNFFLDKGIKVNYSDGGKIDLDGMKFDEVFPIFWEQRYIPAYIEEIFDSCVPLFQDLEEKFGDHPNDILWHCESIFSNHIEQTYEYMADIDRRLRGDSKKITVTDFIKSMKEIISKRISCYKLGTLRSLYWYGEKVLGKLTSFIRFN